MANILVYIELVDDSASWASLLTLRQARSLSTHVGATIYAVLPCATPPLYGENDIIAILSRQGADKVILMTHTALAEPAVFQSHGEALLTAANQFPPALMLLPEGSAASEIGPRVATRLGGLFFNQPDLVVDEQCALTISQPLFDDTQVRHFSTADLEHSVVAVVAPDPQQYSRPLGVEEAEVVVISPGFDEETTLPRPEPAQQDALVPATRPQRMILVGAAVSAGEELDAVLALGDQLGAPVFLTPGAADKGLDGAPVLGTAPLVCRPQLVLAFGVNGTEPTLRTLPSSTYLVCVHPDRAVPLFRRAQLGLVAPVLQAAREMRAEAEAAPVEHLLPPPPDEPDDGDDDDLMSRDPALVDTIPPGAARAEPASPGEPQDPALEDTVKQRKTSQAKASADGVDPAFVSTVPVDQLGHTPPFGTPMPQLGRDVPEATPQEQQQDVLALGVAATLRPTDPFPGSLSAPEDPATEKTPEATPAGTPAQPGDPALDDTVEAPLPGATAKPSQAPAAEDPALGDTQETPAIRPRGGAAVADDAPDPPAEPTGDDEPPKEQP